MFAHYVGIDYSGKGLPSQRHTAIQIFESDAAGLPVRAMGRSSWSRAGAFRYLADRLQEQRGGGRGAMIVGIDHGLSFPLSYFREATAVKPAFGTWWDFMRHFHALWGAAKERPVSSVAAPTLPYGHPAELRLTEKFTSSAKSVLNLDPRLISVAFSTHAGLPWLYELRRDYADVLHVWPFDGLLPEAGKSVVAEAYPSLFYNRYAYPAELAKRDERDAYAVSCWLREQDAAGTLPLYLALQTLTPMTREKIVPLEGWILGVL
ncbi:hypothetical protein I8J29_14865 [Paenibacillus sp. MWE-103]|uniref:DUF429 domain-containing protein n=1 Tax=Paenibacillus artemisiicola TaxID=1172618 RepID=A0ABS3WB04_9BACL|nr:hypothetical protein [Paenibacillus artemisiicola]MBO7745488.1 hypothetical protein [Paenibacillus artemisiicola]